MHQLSPKALLTFTQSYKLLIFNYELLTIINISVFINACMHRGYAMLSETSTNYQFRLLWLLHTVWSAYTHLRCLL